MNKYNAMLKIVTVTELNNGGDVSHREYVYQPPRALAEIEYDINRTYARTLYSALRIRRSPDSDRSAIALIKRESICV